MLTEMLERVGEVLDTYSHVLPTMGDDAAPAGRVLRVLSDSTSSSEVATKVATN